VRLVLPWMVTGGEVWVWMLKGVKSSNILKNIMFVIFLEKEKGGDFVKYKTLCEIRASFSSFCPLPICTEARQSSVGSPTISMRG